MLLGFYLASLTSARADDLDLVGSDGLSATVDQVLDTANEVVEPTREALAPVTVAEWVHVHVGQGLGRWWDPGLGSGQGAGEDQRQRRLGCR